MNNDDRNKKNRIISNLTNTNRKWQNHLKSKGFTAFIYDRLSTYCLEGPNNDTFNFDVRNDHENELAKYWFDWMEEFPYQLYTEVTNHCNLDCIFCARKKMTRPKGIMSFELFKKIVDEVCIVRPASYLHIYGIGDPLMDPGIVKKMDYTCRINKMPNQVFGTNGCLLLKKNVYKTLIDMNIPHINIDIDGFSKKSYENIRVGGNFNEIINTVRVVTKYIKEVGARTRIELVYQIVTGTNDHEVGAFTTWCTEYGYEYKLINLHSWAGLREEYVKNVTTQRTSPCRAQWDGMMICWNGDVTTCFQDANGHEIFGNVIDQSIKEIWQNALRIKRREHVQGIFNGLCQNCDSYKKPGMPCINSVVFPDVLRSEVADNDLHKSKRATG